MTDEQKKNLREAIEKKIAQSQQTVIDLKEATKPMGLDSSIGRFAEWIISTIKLLTKLNFTRLK